MEKSSSNVEMRSSRDFAEYAEICRAAATVVRMASNVILNVHVDGVLDTKKQFESWCKNADNVCRVLFSANQAFMKCANIALQKEKSSETASGAKMN